jgi:hypothetical protein
VDLRSQLVVTAYVAKRLTNEDLSTFVARNAQGADYHITEFARLKGVLAEACLPGGTA